MARIHKIDLYEVGLGMLFIIVKFFLKSEYLHYGFFSDGLKGDISNLAKAQENYADFLLSQIPEGVKTIIDVGCGSGKMAQNLVRHGYRVDCVSPNSLLNEHARKLLGDDSEIFQCKYQELQTEKRYDMILFSETFHYIPIDISIENSLKFANPRGYIMICDFFKTNAPGKSRLGGGYKLSTWEKKTEKFPLTMIKEQDITEETAPTIDIVNSLSEEVFHPIWNLISRLAEDRYPHLLKLVKWKFRKKIAKIENKHFSGQRTGENFKKYKKYMFYLFQKRD